MNKLPAARHCIVCEKELKHAGPRDDNEPDQIEFPPDNAIHWTTSGNWGSTVFDSGGPFGGELLECFICDECVKQRSKYIFRYHFHSHREIANVRVFDPEENWTI